MKINWMKVIGVFLAVLNIVMVAAVEPVAAQIAHGAVASIIIFLLCELPELKRWTK